MGDDIDIVDPLLRWNKRVAVVTGASRGIGMCIAERLVQAGMLVVGVAPQIEKIESRSLDYRSAGYNGTLIPMQCDITDPHKVTQLFASIKGDPDLEGVDLVVNNAGVALAESWLTGSPQAWKQMFDVNVLGASYVTQEGFKSMQDRGVTDGHFVFINSLAGHRVSPGNKELHVYSATKHAQQAMVEGLRLELRGMETQTRVTAISPGVVETDLYVSLFQGDTEKAHAFLSERKYLEAVDVAEAVVYAISQPPHVQVHDIQMRSTDQIP